MHSRPGLRTEAAIAWAVAGTGGRPPTAPADPQDEARADAAGPLRVLIVEDEAVIALSLQATVEQLGHTVIGIVARGAAAIAAAERRRPDLILMDVRLADAIDGISAAEAILARRPVPIVFTTAYSDRGVVDRIRGLGGDLLPKPIDPERLRRTLAHLPTPRPGAGRTGPQDA